MRPVSNRFGPFAWSDDFVAGIHPRLEPSHDPHPLVAVLVCDGFGAKWNSDVKLISSNNSEEARSGYPHYLDG